MSRLAPYNYEFETLEDLEKIVKEVMEEINNDKSYATNEKPLVLLEKEKEYLLPLPNQELINNYFTKPISRIVTKESMVTYMNNKYSLNPKYIGKKVNLEVKNDTLTILYENEIIANHKIGTRRFNYRKEDMIAILKTDAMKFAKDEEIEDFARKQLALYDNVK